MFLSVFDGGAGGACRYSQTALPISFHQHTRKSVIPSKSGILGVAHHTVSFVLDKFRMLSQLCALGNLWANIGKFPGFCGLGLSLQRK
jgi:hypothetical protein